MATESQAWERIGKDILSDPNNDSLRMRFAALLEEDESKENHDHARARFIHLQLALARLLPIDSQWMRLILQAESLLLDHKKEWLPTWYGEADVRDAEFHRGFIEAITVSATSLMNRSEEIFTQSPVRHLASLIWVTLRFWKPCWFCLRVTDISIEWSPSGSTDRTFATST
jgi:hypothetical protein